MNKTIQQEVLNGLYCLNALVVSQTAALISVVCENDILIEYKQFIYSDFDKLASFGIPRKELLSFEENLQGLAERLRDAKQIDFDIEEPNSRLDMYFHLTWFNAEDEAEIKAFAEDTVKDKEFFHHDNWRLALVGNHESEKFYKQKSKDGCCGFFDEKLTVKSGRTYKIGFNYGH